jgi:hypothetical protein
VAVAFNANSGADSAAISAVTPLTVAALRIGFLVDVLLNLTPGGNAQAMGLVGWSGSQSKMECGIGVNAGGHLVALELFNNSSQTISGVGNVTDLLQSALPATGTPLDLYFYYSSGIGCGMRLYNGLTKAKIFERSDATTAGTLNTNGGICELFDWEKLTGVAGFAAEALYMYVDNALAANQAEELSRTINSGKTVAGWATTEHTTGAATSLTAAIGGQNLTVFGTATYVTPPIYPTGGLTKRQKAARHLLLCA